MSRPESRSFVRRSLQRGGGLAVAALVAGTALAGPALAAAPGSTTVVDQPSGSAGLVGFGNYGSLGEGGDSVSGDPAGRWVVFVSAADSLLASTADDAGGAHVYELDRQTGIVIPVSLDNGGALVDASDPSVSADGTKVAFVTDARIDPADTDTKFSTYVRYLATGQTVLASRATGVAGAPAGSFDAPRISADGTRVVFVTAAALTPAVDTNGKPDVYLRNLVLGTTELVSRATTSGGAVGNGTSDQPVIDADGSTVAFTSTSTNLDAVDDANGVKRDVFARDTVAHTTDLVSMRNTLTGGGDDDSFQPDLSSSGNTVVFTSRASDITAAASGNYTQVFRRQISVAGSQTVLVSKNAGGIAADADAERGSVATQGANVSVAFRSDATNLTADKTSSDSAIFLDDSTIRLVSRGPGAAGGQLTENGGYTANMGAGSRTIAYESNDSLLIPGSRDFGHVVVRDMADPAEPQTFADHAQGAPLPAVDGAGDADLVQSDGAMSADGRFVLFLSDADAVLGASSRESHLFRRDLRTGQTIVVGRADGSAGALPADGVAGLSISDDGNVVAFSTFAALDPADTNGTMDVYVRDVAAATTRLASRASGADGPVGDQRSEHPSVSGDGTHVAWDTDAANLGDGGGPGANTDIYVRDLRTGVTSLASRADGPGSVAGDGSSIAASLNGDGTVVAFSTSAKNLGDGDTSKNEDVHVRDLAAGTTRLASRATGASGAVGDQSSDRPSISSDGTRVVFESDATTLVPDDSDANDDIYLRDLAAATTVLVSRADGAAGATGNATSREPAISGDGRIVAYESFSTALVPGVGPAPGQNVTQIYVRDVAANTTAVASRSDGATGAPADDRLAGDAQLDGDGSCVVFASGARSLALGSGVSSDFVRIYLRALGGECPFAAPVVPGPGPGTGSGPTTGPGPGTTPPAARPVVSGAKLTNARFRVGTKATATSAAVRKRAPVGTRVDFKLSAGARIRLTLARATAGKRVGTSCVKPTAKLRKRKRCTRYVAAGTLRRTGKAGLNRIAFSGRVGRKALPAGAYRVRIVATNAGGTSVARTLAFRVVRR